MNHVESIGAAGPVLCPSCGFAPCGCQELHHQRKARGRMLAAIGLEQARSGDVYNALLTLRSALASGAAEPRVFEVAGLCALAAGDPQSARRWWRQAEVLNADSPAGQWRNSLEHGEVNTALVSYNLALDAANARAYEQARSHLATSLEHLSGFLPAIHLAGVLSRVSSTGSEPQPVARSWALKRTIPLVAAASFLLGLSVWPVLSSRDRRASAAPAAGRYDTVVATAINRTAPNLGGATLPASMAAGLAFDGNVDSVSALIETANLDTVAWSRQAKGELRRQSIVAAQRHLSSGRNESSGGSLAVAVASLKRAAHLAAGSYLEDDVLYELAQVLQRAGQPAEAAATATRVLTSFPRSIFANSVMKRLAGRQTQTTREQ